MRPKESLVLIKQEQRSPTPPREQAGFPFGTEGQGQGQGLGDGAKLALWVPVEPCPAWTSPASDDLGSSCGA